MSTRDESPVVRVAKDGKPLRASPWKWEGGEVIHNHFADSDEMVMIGSGAEKSMETIFLSRYACYLIVQNSDPTKVVVAKGQTYFAIQTRRQERTDSLIEDNNRVFLREEIKKHNSGLMRTVTMAGG